MLTPSWYSIARYSELTPNQLWDKGLSGGPSGDRTLDPQIKSPLPMHYPAQVSTDKDNRISHLREKALFPFVPDSPLFSPRSVTHV